MSQTSSFADEPTGSLDSKNRAELQELFFQLRRDLGQTFVIVTHDEAFAQQCDRCIHMVDGRISDDAAAPSQDCEQGGDEQEVTPHDEACTAQAEELLSEDVHSESSQNLAE